MMIYFVYGSNMNWDRMHEHCPSARFLFKAKLKGFRLDFTPLLHHQPLRLNLSDE